MQAISSAVQMPAEPVLEAAPAPAAGQVVWLRNRLARVEDVQRFGARARRPSHLASALFLDGESPRRLKVLWELERVVPGHLEPLPQVADSPVDPRLLTEWLSAARWNLRHPLPDLPDTRQLPDWWHQEAGPLLSVITSRFSPEGFQLVPLEAAMKMPRVRLLLADEVGMGKTLEAGLVASELVVRRRINRMLILCPPALMDQWASELQCRFGLSTSKLERGKEPAGHRLIASYHYLKRPPVLERFLQTCSNANQGRLPWDLLIVDEAHNLAPAPRGPESQLTAMLRQLSRWFEHRVFITATPHDGYSSSLTGLLEMLDPVQFRRTALPTDLERERMDKVIIRQNRLPADCVGKRGDSSRTIIPIPVQFSTREQALFDTYNGLKEDLARWGGIPASGKRESLVFAIQNLGKRLLSSTPAFASSFALFYCQFHGQLPGWLDHETQTGNWKRVAQLLRHWCDLRFPKTGRRIEDVRQALLDLDAWPDPEDGLSQPDQDSRMDAFVAWLRKAVLPSSGDWGQASRALIFTEFRTTQQYIERVIAQQLEPHAERVAVLHSKVPPKQRKEILESFRDVDAPVRLLLATDVASEGLNLQLACHKVFNFDIPWNPARMEQRAGRVDRHGQTSPVSIFHFESPEGLDLGLRLRVASKMEVMAEDLGPVRPLISAVSKDLSHPFNGPALFPETVFSSGENRGPARPGLSQRGSGAPVQCQRQLRELLWCAQDGRVAVSTQAMARTRHTTWLLLQQFLSNQKGACWAPLCAPSLPIHQGAIRLFFRSLALAQDGTPVHAWLGQCRVPADKMSGPWRCHPDRARITDEAPSVRHRPGAQLQREARELWHQCAPQVATFVAEYETEYRRCLASAVHEAGRAGQARMRHGLALRKKELDAFGLDRHSARLKEHLANLARERKKKGFLFPEMLVANLIRADEAGRELAGLQQQHQRLEEALQWEKRTVNERLKKSCELICEPVVFLEAALVEVGAATGRRRAS